MAPLTAVRTWVQHRMSLQLSPDLLSLSLLYCRQVETAVRADYDMKCCLVTATLSLPHPPALSADAARQPPAATVGQRVNFQCDRLAEPHREIRVVLHRVLGQRVDEDIEPVAVHHQVGHHMRELVGLEQDQNISDWVRPARRVAEGLDLDLAMRPECRAHPFGNGACACRIVVDVGVIAQVMDGFGSFLGHRASLPAG
jgi:hypothetical protein